MTTATDDTRLGIMEGRLAEQSIALQELREGQRETNQNWQAGLRETNQNWQAGLRETSARIDRLFLAILGIGAAQIGLLITLVVQG